MAGVRESGAASRKGVPGAFPGVGRNDRATPCRTPGSVRWTAEALPQCVGRKRYLRNGLVRSRLTCDRAGREDSLLPDTPVRLIPSDEGVLRALQRALPTKLVAAAALLRDLFAYPSASIITSRRSRKSSTSRCDHARGEPARPRPELHHTPHREDIHSSHTGARQRRPI